MNDQEILKERAFELSSRKLSADKEIEKLQVVGFVLAPERYAIESSFVTEVLLLKDLTTIPGIPAFIAGITNIRGKIVSILNLKVLLNIKVQGITEHNRVIMLKDGAMEFGILADAISGTSGIDISAISDPPEANSRMGNPYLMGITSDSLIVLDAAKLLSASALIIDQKK